MFKVLQFDLLLLLVDLYARPLGPLTGLLRVVCGLGELITTHGYSGQPDINTNTNIG